MPKPHCFLVVLVHEGDSASVQSTLVSTVVRGVGQDNLIAIVHTTTPHFSYLCSHIEACWISPTMLKHHGRLVVHVGDSASVPSTAVGNGVRSPGQDNLLAIVHCRCSLGGAVTAAARFADLVVALALALALALVLAAVAVFAR